MYNKFNKEQCRHCLSKTNDPNLPQPCRVLDKGGVCLSHRRKSKMKGNTDYEEKEMSTKTTGVV